MGLRALVVGATGLVGNVVVEKLLATPHFTEVVVLARRPLPIQHPKLSCHLVNFDHLEPWKGKFQADVFFCCLGTTIKTAGSKENFYKVDYTYAMESSKLAHANGAKTCVLVSALGSDQKSMFFYSRVKGDLEKDIQNIPFQSISIVQPSLLLGNRIEKRAGEKLAIQIYTFIEPIFIGPLKKYKGISADKVANALISKGLASEQGVHFLPSEKLHDFDKIILP